MGDRQSRVTLSIGLTRSDGNRRAKSFCVCYLFNEVVLLAQMLVLDDSVPVPESNAQSFEDSIV